jgi:hypothetical protein
LKSARYLHTLPLFFCILILTGPITLTWASSSFTLTVTTKKPCYYLGGIVEIHGNLTLHGVPVQNALVGLEVINSDKTIIIRTLPTGSSPQQNWLIEALSVVPCNQWGIPKDTFKPGTLSYFNVTIQNTDIEAHQVLITVNVYDSSQAPIGLSTFTAIIIENSTSEIIISVTIPETATLGTAATYANVYSGLPKIGGKPHCPEKSAQFQIVSSKSKSTTLSSENYETLTLNGNFTTTFKLPPSAQAGAYQVYASSIYEYYTAINSTTFSVKVLGDVNGDFVVNVGDLALLGVAWWSTSKDLNWNEECDFDKNGRIDIGDLAVMGAYWGYGF